MFCVGEFVICKIRQIYNANLYKELELSVCTWFIQWCRDISWRSLYHRPIFSVKVFPDMGISIKKIRRSWCSAHFHYWMYKTPPPTHDNVNLIFWQCIFDISFRSHPYQYMHFLVNQMQMHPSAIFRPGNVCCLPHHHILLMSLRGSVRSGHWNIYHSRNYSGQSIT